MIYTKFYSCSISYFYFSSLFQNSIVANSQLLLIGYNAIDGKPYIMTKIDIEEILTPNIMVYEVIIFNNLFLFFLSNMDI